MIGIGNGRQAGGGQPLCPDALINDGLLDLLVITGEELLPAIFTTITQQEDNPHLVRGRSGWIEITSPHSMTFNLDGEPLSGQTFRIDILSDALRARLPPDCQLLR